VFHLHGCRCGIDDQNDDENRDDENREVVTG
jgi:hypothetical protein